MKKIIVIGCPGSGKSTFSKRLHNLTGIPLFHLDLLYWKPDRSPIDKNLFLKQLSEIIQTDEWIIDGNYISTMELRLQSCDTVVFLDYDSDICLDGVRSRIGKIRSDIPWVENEEDTEFIESVKNYNLKLRPGVMALLDKYRHKNIYIFKTRNETDMFLNQF